MNSTIYLFGKFGQGYTQYPFDASQEIFLKMADGNTSSKTWISTHRKGDLMYYAYIRKLDSNIEKQYFGMSILLNGVMITNLASLFELFENTFSNIVFSSIILKFNEDGNIVSNISHFSDKKAEIDRIASFLTSNLSSFDNYCQALPSESYGISSSETKSFPINHDHKELIKACHSYSYTYILKADDYDTSMISSYRGIIKKLKSEKTDLEKKNNQLKSEYDKVLAQKKQYRIVGLLALAFIACGVILYFVSGTLNKTKEDLSNARFEIQNLQSDVAILDRKLKKTNDSLEDYRKKYNKNQVLLNTITPVFPIVISDIQIANVYQGGDIETDYGETIYSNNTMYLKPKIKYVGINTYENIDLNVKLFSPAGTVVSGSSAPDGYSFVTNLYVEYGENEKELTGFGNTNKGNWSSGTYKYEIWFEDVCLKTKSFTIY